MTSDQYSELIEFLGGKFDAIDRRFDAIDRRFEAVDQRFEASDQRFEAIDQRFETMDQRFETMDQRFEEAKLERAEIRDEARRHANVLFEQSQANLKAVAEGLGLRIERLEAALPYSGGA